LQQSLLLLHAAPSAKQPTAQAPPAQMPLQHWLFAVQPVPGRWQVQKPLMQLPTQHWGSAVHVYVSG
jgi:hypothetical protein